MLKRILKRILYYILVAVLAFATYHATTTGVWAYRQLEKAERVESQLKEVYLELAYVNDKVGEYVENVNDIFGAIVIDVVNINNTVKNNEEETEKRIVEVGEEANIKLALLAQQSFERDKDLLGRITHATERPSYDLLKSMTVMVLNPSQTNPEMASLGTGVVVRIDEEYTYILTNNHVCSANTETDCLIRNDDGSLVPVEPFKGTDSGYDMTVLRTASTLEGKIAIPKIVSATHQDRLFVVGHHLGRPFIYGEGVFAGYDEKDEVVQIPLMYGNSGSGIFNQKGELIGLLFGGKGQSLYQMDFSHGQIVPGAVLKLFLKDLVK